MKEAELKAKLFGKIKLVKATSKFKISEEILSQPFEKNDSIIYCFCYSCGSVGELNRGEAQKAAQIAGIKLPSKLKQDNYFETGGCEFCEGQENKASFK